MQVGIKHCCAKPTICAAVPETAKPMTLLSKPSPPHHTAQLTRMTYVRKCSRMHSSVA